VVGTLLTLGLLLAEPQVAQAQPNQPCLNYEVPTSWGKLTIDTRPDNVGADGIGVIVVWLFLNNPHDSPGAYTWAGYINGSLIRRGVDVKDDNFHTAIRRTIRENGREITNYNPGDTFHIDITHPVDGGRTVYETPLNECYIASY
jgi:hypothetical protein